MSPKPPWSLGTLRPRILLLTPLLFFLGRSPGQPDSCLQKLLRKISSGMQSIAYFQRTESTLGQWLLLPEYLEYWTQWYCWINSALPQKNNFQDYINMYIGPLVFFVSKSRRVILFVCLFVSDVSCGVRALYGQIIWTHCFKWLWSYRTLMILFSYFNPKESTYQTFSSCSPNSLPVEWPTMAAAGRSFN